MDSPVGNLDKNYWILFAVLNRTTTTDPPAGAAAEVEKL